MTDQHHTRGRIPGKVLVIVLLLAVLIVGAYAVWRITLSTKESKSGATPVPSDTTTATTSVPAQRPGMPAYQMTEADIDALKARGLEDPINDLFNDLKNHPELIPKEGVLGGTMRFVPEESRVISPQRVNAYYEDGHTAGRVLLEYQVDSGNITWTVIQSLPN